MTQYDESQCYPVGPNMVSYKNELFSVHFPRILYESILKCVNCKYYGKWNGCIILQCINCASENNACNETNTPFNHGAIGIGIEFNKTHPNSASSTYLKGVDWNTIGDIHLENSKKILKEPDFKYTHTEFMDNYTTHTSKVQFIEDITQEPESKFKSDSGVVESQSAEAIDSSFNTYNLYRLANKHYKVTQKMTDALLKSNLDNKFENQHTDILAIECAILESIKIQSDKMTPDGFENPLHDVMSWCEVEKVFEEWKIINSSEQDQNQTCLEWAKNMKGILHDDDDDKMPELILADDDDEMQYQLADLQNQTGIFDWTPDNSFGEGPDIETGYSTVVDMY